MSLPSLGNGTLAVILQVNLNQRKTVNLVFLQVEEDLLQLVPGILDRFVPDDKTTCDKKLFC